MIQGEIIQKFINRIIQGKGVQIKSVWMSGWTYT